MTPGFLKLIFKYFQFNIILKENLNWIISPISKVFAEFFKA